MFIKKQSRTGRRKKSLEDHLQAPLLGHWIEKLIKSHKMMTMKYRDKMVNIVFNQEENKFCFNQPIAPTSVIGGAEGGISCFLTKAIFVIILPQSEMSD